MGREVFKGNKLILLILLFIIGYFSSGFTGNAIYYRNFGYGSGGFQNFGMVYQEYGTMIDAAIFLIIFLGLVQSVLKDHFKNAKGIYIGLGLFLTFALVLFEERTGMSLLVNFGPVVLLIFLGIIVVFANKALREHANMGALPSLALIYIFLWIFLIQTETGVVFMNWLTDTLNWNADRDIFDILGFIAILVIIGALALAAKKKAKQVYGNQQANP